MRRTGKQVFLVLVAAMGVLLCTGAYAQDTDQRIKALEDKIEQLQQEIEAIKQEAAGTAVTTQQAAEKAGRGLKLSGLMEFETSFLNRKSFGGAKLNTSDAVLATMELDMAADIADGVTGEVVYLWEEDDTEPNDLDVGLIHIDLSDHFALSAGKGYLPIADSPTFFISDPVTLELGETRETMLALEASSNDNVSFSLTLFNGDIERMGKSGHLNDYVAAVQYAEPETGNAVGVRYIKDFSDTDIDITGKIAADGGPVLQKTPAGLNVYGSYTFEPVTLVVDYVGSLGSFDAADLDADGDGSGDRPSAYNIELGFNFSRKYTWALKYSGTKQLSGWPKTMYGVAWSTEIRPNTNLSAEYLHGKYSEGFGGGPKADNLLTTQIAVTF